MQSQMSSSPGLVPPPHSTPGSPSVVPTPPQAPRGSRLPWIVIGLIAVAGLGWYMWSRQEAAKQRASAAAGSGGAAIIRTSSVRKGDLVQTIRLTGNTGAERFASLLVPQLRGSRGDGLRDGKTFTSPGANYNITSNSSRSVGGNSVGAAPSASGSGSGDVASTMGQSTGGSSALRSATSRVGNTARGSGGSMTAATNGDTGLGSTASALVGGGGGGGGGTGVTVSGGGGGRGGGGGGGDYALVLQSTGKSGGLVKKGDVVAEFDRVNMLNRLEDYRAAVAQMDASFVKLKAEVEAQRKARLQSVDNAKATLDQAILDVKTIPVLGAIEAERVKLAAEEAEAKYKQLVAELKFAEASYASQIKVSQLELQQSHVELKRAEANTDRMIMKAPINGLIVMQTIFRGSEMAQIQAGDQLYAGMRFMQIVDPSAMVVNTTLNQVDSDLIRVGAKATVRFDAFPGLELPATVQALGAMTRPGMQRAAFVKEIPVILKLDRLDPRVIPDLSVSVDVEIASSKQETIAPLAAVFEDESQSNHATWAWVRKENGWEKRQVQTGLSNNLDVVIKSGLQPGEVVALDRPPDETAGQSRG